jgi:hypothetical protein
MVEASDIEVVGASTGSPHGRPGANARDRPYLQPAQPLGGHWASAQVVLSRPSLNATVLCPAQVSLHDARLFK